MYNFKSRNRKSVIHLRRTETKERPRETDRQKKAHRNQYLFRHIIAQRSLSVLYLYFAYVSWSLLLLPSIFFECIILFHEINVCFMLTHVMRWFIIVIVIYAFNACMPIRAHSECVYSIYCYECWWCCWLLRCRLMQLTICLFLFLLDWHVVYCYAHIVCVSKTCLFKWYVIFSKSSTKNTQMNGIQQQRQKYHTNTVLNVTDAVSMKFNAFFFWKNIQKYSDHF